jgi:MATE family multidrug resistance protein
MFSKNYPVFLKNFIKETNLTFALAFPIMAGAMGQQAIGLVDIAMLGQLGVTPIAASSFANNLFIMAFVFGIGLTIPVSIFAARAYGAKDAVDGSEVLRHGLLLGFVSGIVLGDLLTLLVPFFRYMGQPPEVIEIVTPFYVLISWTVVPLMIFFILRLFCEALHKPWFPVWATWLSVLLNAFLNWLLIFGHWGFPRLGIIGSGIASTISRWMTIGILIFMMKHCESLKPYLNIKWRQPFVFSRLKEMLHVGIPSSIHSFSEAGGCSIIGIMMGWLGTVPLAAYQIVFACLCFLFSIIIGFSSAARVRVGHSIGASRPDHVVKIGFNVWILVSVFMIFCMLVFVFLGPGLMRIFTHDQAAIELGTMFFLIATIFQLFDGTQGVFAGLLQGLKDTTYCMIVGIIGYWIIMLSVAYVLGFVLKWGAIGVWDGFIAGIGTVAVAFVIRFFIKNKKLLAFDKINAQP